MHQCPRCPSQAPMVVKVGPRTNTEEEVPKAHKSKEGVGRWWEQPLVYCTTSHPFCTPTTIDLSPALNHVGLHRLRRELSSHHWWKLRIFSTWKWNPGWIEVQWSSNLLWSHSLWQVVNNPLFVKHAVHSQGLKKRQRSQLIFWCSHSYCQIRI